MTTIKSFTSLEQSKRLTEILPLESADMHYCLEQRDVATGYEIGITPFTKAKGFIGKCNIIDVQPSWSLAALLDVLPKNLKIGRPSLESNYTGYYWIQYYDEFMKPNNYRTECFNNPVDACVAMIEKLYELKML